MISPTHITTVPVNVHIRDEDPRMHDNNTIRINVQPQGNNPHRVSFIQVLIPRAELERALRADRDTWAAIPARMITAEHNARTTKVLIKR